MIRRSSVALVVLATVSGAWAQDRVVTTEKTVTTNAPTSTRVETRVESAPADTTVRTERTESESTTVDGNTRTKTTVSSTSSYTTRLENAYRAAGVSDAEIAKLRDIDVKVLEARRAGDTARVKEYYTQQTRILQPEQLTKVRTYLVEHPAPKTVPAYEVTTYETVPTGTGVSVTTPLGNIGLGVNTGSTVVEKKEVVPAP